MTNGKFVNWNATGTLFLFLFILTAGSIHASNATAKIAAPSPEYQVTIQMDCGRFVIQLFPAAAPRNVARVVQLVRQGFYDGLRFHRVVSGILVQGGDPKGDGSGGSGVKLPAEINSKRMVTGTVAMAHGSDPNSADSQFFICLSPQPLWEGRFTVIGQVVAGFDVLKKIKQGDVMKKVMVQ